MCRRETRVQKKDDSRLFEIPGDRTTAFRSQVYESPRERGRVSHDSLTPLSLKIKNARRMTRTPDQRKNKHLVLFFYEQRYKVSEDLK